MNVDQKAFKNELLALFNEGMRMMRIAGLNAPDLTMAQAETIEAFNDMSRHLPPEESLNFIDFLLAGSAPTGKGYERVRYTLMGHRATHRIERKELVPLEEAAAYSGMQLNSFRTKISKSGVKTVNVEGRAHLTGQQIISLRT